MNRCYISALALLAAAMPMVMDSALKGAALLSAAAVAALVLWHASAAARHLVWLVAVLALLLVPVLSVVLPGWRVLPAWAVATEGTTETERTEAPEGTVLRAPSPSLPDPALPQLSAEPVTHAEAFSEPAVSSIPSVPLVSSVPLASPAPATWLPLTWCAGCLVLLLRLFSAHWLLRRASRRCQAVPETRLASALAEAAQQLGVRQDIRFLMDQKRTIPVVWGVIWPRLILPAEALSWDDAKLRSVLLHELAHIRRRDTLVQWLTQLACALHWFNPLVWLAAWRLHTERERACDDLVLASGVKASAYAGHLLDVASKLTPVRWTSACGLAMARKSSLESRLRAVLSGNLNRRSVTRLLALAAVLLTAAIAVPLAMLRAAETEKAKPAEAPVNVEPKTAASKSLFNHWKRSSRADGKIPGGCIGQVATSLKTYMDLNAGTDYATKCEPVLKKCDATHDWIPADAAALLDEIETVAPDHARWTMRAINVRQIHPGKPLPDELKDAPWGTPADNGLRMAWLCGTGVPPVSPDPAAKDQSNKDEGGLLANGQNAPATLGTVLTSRVLFHNTGKKPVCFATQNWIQSGTHAAKDAKGKEIPINATQRLGERTRMIFRLDPGDYAEVEGHGIGIGSHETAKETDIRKVGAWIEAKEGDVVTFTPGNLLVSFQTWQNNEGRKDSETAWQEIISARLAQEGPNPASEKDRAALLARVSEDLGITLPYDEAKFTYETDPLPDAFQRLTKRFLEAAKPMHFAGELAGGETKFTVTTKPKDPSDKSERSDKTSSNQPAVEADLGGQQHATQIIIQVTADGTYVVQKETLTLKQLEERLATIAAANKEQTITIRADKDTEMKFVSKVMEACGKAGLNSISFAEPKPASENKSHMSHESHASYSEEPTLPTPKHEYAQALFKQWRSFARTDGKIPVALIGHVAEQMDSFLKQYPTDSKAPALAAIRPQLDATHDWTPDDVVQIMDDITEISTAPISWASTPMEFAEMNKLLPGKPFPEELQKANWGKPATNGLRAAYLLVPSAPDYPLNTVLKARVLFHNTGTAPVIVRTETWHQNDKHRGGGILPPSQNPAANPLSTDAHDHQLDGAGGKNAPATVIPITSTWYTGMTPIATYRLAPGEYAEVPAHGIAVGAGGYTEEHSTGSVGAVIEATAGQTVRFSSEVDAINEGWMRPNDPKDPTELYLKNIADRIALEAPLPKSTADRELLIVHATQNLFGQSPTEAEVAMFTTDVAPDALEKLTARLQAKPRPIPFSGKLQTGETTFKVLPADPNAAKAPRTATGPGRYVLGENVHLQVTETTDGDKRTNKATILFLSPDPKVALPHQPYEIELPEGNGTYALAWERGAEVLWIMQAPMIKRWSRITKHKDGSMTRTFPDANGQIVEEFWDKASHRTSRTVSNFSIKSSLIRKIDFSDPPQIKLTELEPGRIDLLPASILNKLSEFPKSDGKSGLTVQPATEQKLKWGEPGNGLRMALAWAPTSGEPDLGMETEFYLVVQNVSDGAVHFLASTDAPNPRRLTIRKDDKPLSALNDPTVMAGDWLLKPHEVAFVKLFQPLENGDGTASVSSAVEADVCAFPQYSLTAEMSIEKAPENLSGNFEKGP